MKKKTIFTVAGIAIISAIAVALYMYNKPRTSIQSIDPDYTVKAADWASEYSEDEESGNARYLGKVILVEGFIMEINREASSLILEGNGLNNVQCGFLPENPLPNSLMIGDPVKIKGRCTGILLDVVLNESVIVKDY